MALFLIMSFPEAMNRLDDIDDVRMNFQWHAFDTTPGIESGPSGSASAEVTSGMNAQQVEVAMRNAAIAEAALQGFNVPTANCFMPAIRRG